MDIHIDLLLAAAGAVGAAAVLVGHLTRIYRTYFKVLGYEKDIQSLKEEQSLLTVGILACLKGLQEQGCNGPVSEAAAELEAFLNRRAHR